MRPLRPTVFLKCLCLIIPLFLLGLWMQKFEAPVEAQTTPPPQVLGIAGQPATALASSVAQCPAAPPGGYFLCIVAPGGATQPFLALSVSGFNNGAPFQVASQGAIGPAGPVGATGPAGPQGPPGPASTPSVTSVNGKTGAVVLSATIQ